MLKFFTYKLKSMIKKNIQNPKIQSFKTLKMNEINE